MILKRYLKNRIERWGMDSSGSGWEPVVAYYDHGNEVMGCMKH
jgi:hypothetical protein